MKLPNYFQQIWSHLPLSNQVFLLRMLRKLSLKQHMNSFQQKAGDHEPNNTFIRSEDTETSSSHVSAYDALPVS